MLYSKLQQQLNIKVTDMHQQSEKDHKAFFKDLYIYTLGSVKLFVKILHYPELIQTPYARKS